MSALMTSVGTIFTTMIGWVSTVASTITAEGNEILLLGILIPVAFLGVNLFRKLFNI